MIGIITYITLSLGHRHMSKSKLCWPKIVRFNFVTFKTYIINYIYLELFNYLKNSKIITRYEYLEFKFYILHEK